MYSFLNIEKLKVDLKSGLITCKELTEEAIKQISENHRLNAFLEVFESSALAQALVIDEKWFTNLYSTMNVTRTPHCVFDRERRVQYCT